MQVKAFFKDFRISLSFNYLIIIKIIYLLLVWKSGILTIPFKYYR